MPSRFYTLRSIAIACVMVLGPLAHAQDRYFALKDVPISIAPPAGFSPVGDGVTFRHESLNAAIETSKVPAAYADVIKVFTAEEMSKRGMRLANKDNVTVDGRAALLLRVEESASESGIVRWTLVIGDYQETFLVNATFPKSAESTLAAPLRTALMGAKWTKREGPDPFQNFRFTIAPTPKLTFAKELDTLVAFTADGVFPLQQPGDPLLVAGYEINDERITDERAFAQEAFKQVPDCQKMAATETNAITLAGLQGYESIGNGEHAETGEAVSVYQLLLFADGYHVFVLGRVDAKRAASFMDEFKASARTLKLK